MKIGLDSPAGRELQAFGVSAECLRSTSFIGVRRPFIFGGLTVALPFGKSLVFIESRYLRKEDGGELVVDRQLALLRHELCHARQNLDWGFLTYWQRHIRARVMSLSIRARDSSVERDCYRALAEVRTRYPDFRQPGR